MTKEFDPRNLLVFAIIGAGLAASIGFVIKD